MQQTYRIAARENREKLVKGLGWFSIGLGLFEIFAPRTLSRLIGIKPHTGLVRRCWRRGSESNRCRSFPETHYSAITTPPPEANSLITNERQ